ncbi:carotenoid biosynthesis protein [Paenibacillus sp. sgz500958]|uniref:carotenoid biosynthesis protein n=1 Tax=Paenibacillus sp. sgz500958 TaxID=3242475 RepID=UPI0036D243D0
MVSYVFWIWYFIGAVLLTLFTVPESLQFSNGIFLVLYAAYAMDVLKKGASQSLVSDQSVITAYRLPLWVSAVVLWTGGMTAEWIGVHTGKLFGSYVYTDILGPLLYGVPVTLGFAWIAVVYNAVLITRNFGLSGGMLMVVRALQVGLWIVILDLVLDPVAHARGFWLWSGGEGLYGVPWSNFAGWFMVGAFLSSCFHNVRVSERAVILGTRLYQAILVLFGLMGLREGLPLCTVIAGAGALLAEGSLRYAGSPQT